MKSKLKKVIIPVAGLGTRMLPATKAIPKEMLPIINKPIIQFIIEEVIYAGFKEVVLVTHSSKNSIENHFDKSFELEVTLEKRVKRALLKEIRAISKLKISIQSVRQHEAHGLGHAILCAKNIIGAEPFGIVLPDMLISEKKGDDGLTLKEMKKYFDETGKDNILLSKTNKKNLPKYGVANLYKKEIFSKNQKLIQIVEKPTIKKAPSNYFVSGRYIFQNELMKFLEKTKKDKYGEIQLTDAINSYLNSSFEIKPFFLEGKIFDCGDPKEYLFATLEYATKDKSLKKQLINFLEDA